MRWLRRNSSLKYLIQYDLWVERVDASPLKGGTDSLGLKGLVTDLLDEAKELKLRDIRTPIPDDDIDSFRMEVL